MHSRVSSLYTFDAVNHSTVSLFSIPLFRSNLGQLDPITRAWLMQLQFPTQRTAHDHTDDDLPVDQRGMHILDKPQLRVLKLQIQRTLDHFVYDILAVDAHVLFPIQTSWVNLVDAENSVPTHGHSNSMISGVYYIDCDSAAAPLVFEKNYLYTNLFSHTVQPTFRERNNFNSNTMLFYPCPGDIYLFPSHLEHSVPSGFGSNRLSLAFNSFARGLFGSGTDRINLT